MVLSDLEAVCRGEAQRVLVALRAHRHARDLKRGWRQLDEASPIRQLSEWRCSERCGYDAFLKPLLQIVRSPDYAGNITYVALEAVHMVVTALCDRPEAAAAEDPARSLADVLAEVSDAVCECIFAETLQQVDEATTMQMITVLGLCSSAAARQPQSTVAFSVATRFRAFSKILALWSHYQRSPTLRAGAQSVVREMLDGACNDLETQAPFLQQALRKLLMDVRPELPQEQAALYVRCLQRLATHPAAQRCISERSPHAQIFQNTVPVLLMAIGENHGTNQRVLHLLLPAVNRVCWLCVGNWQTQQQPHLAGFGALQVEALISSIYICILAKAMAPLQAKDPLGPGQLSPEEATELLVVLLEALSDLLQPVIVRTLWYSFDQNWERPAILGVIVSSIASLFQDSPSADQPLPSYVVHLSSTVLTRIISSFNARRVDAKPAAVADQEVDEEGAQLLREQQRRKELVLQFFENMERSPKKARSFLEASGILDFIDAARVRRQAEELRGIGAAAADEAGDALQPPEEWALKLTWLLRCWNHGVPYAPMGEFFGQPSADAEQAFAAFVETFNWGACDIDEALRGLLQAFLLPKEAQQIDRVLKVFGDTYFRKHQQHCLQQGGEKGYLRHPDAAYTLAFSVIMLNTDQHNPRLKKRMTVKDFMSNNRGINEGENLPEDVQARIFESIHTEEIKTPSSGALSEGVSASRWLDLMQLVERGYRDNSLCLTHAHLGAYGLCFLESAGQRLHNALESALVTDPGALSDATLGLEELLHLALSHQRPEADSIAEGLFFFGTGVFHEQQHYRAKRGPGRASLSLRAFLLAAQAHLPRLSTRLLHMLVYVAIKFALHGLVEKSLLLPPDSAITMLLRKPTLVVDPPPGVVYSFLRKFSSLPFRMLSFGEDDLTSEGSLSRIAQSQPAMTGQTGAFSPPARSAASTPRGRAGAEESPLPSAEDVAAAQQEQEQQQQQQQQQQQPPPPPPQQQQQQQQQQPQQQQQAQQPPPQSSAQPEEQPEQPCDQQPDPQAGAAEQQPQASSGVSAGYQSDGSVPPSDDEDGGPPSARRGATTPPLPQQSPSPGAAGQADEAQPQPQESPLQPQIDGAFGACGMEIFVGSLLRPWQPEAAAAGARSSGSRAARRALTGFTSAVFQALRSSGNTKGNKEHDLPLFLGDEVPAAAAADRGEGGSRRAEATLPPAGLLLPKRTLSLNVADGFETVRLGLCLLHASLGQRPAGALLDEDDAPALRELSTHVHAGLSQTLRRADLTERTLRVSLVSLFQISTMLLSLRTEQGPVVSLGWPVRPIQILVGRVSSGEPHLLVPMAQLITEASRLCVSELSKCRPLDQLDFWRHLLLLLLKAVPTSARALWPGAKDSVVQGVQNQCWEDGIMWLLGHPCLLECLRHVQGEETISEASTAASVSDGKAAAAAPGAPEGPTAAGFWSWILGEVTSLAEEMLPTNRRESARVLLEGYKTLLGHIMQHGASAPSDALGERVCDVDASRRLEMQAAAWSRVVASLLGNIGPVLARTTTGYADSTTPEPPLVPLLKQCLLDVRVPGMLSSSEHGPYWARATLEKLVSILTTAVGGDRGGGAPIPALREAAPLVAKFFLQNLQVLQRHECFSQLWLMVLRLMLLFIKRGGEVRDEMVEEIATETLKNLLCVMLNTKLLAFVTPKSTTDQPPQEGVPVWWQMTWDCIEVFLPGFGEEFTKSMIPRLPSDAVGPDSLGEGNLQVPLPAEPSTSPATQLSIGTAPGATAPAVPAALPPAAPAAQVAPLAAPAMPGAPAQPAAQAGAAAVAAAPAPAGAAAVAAAPAPAGAAAVAAAPAVPARVASAFAQQAAAVQPVEMQAPGSALGGLTELFGAPPAAAPTAAAQT